MIHVQPVREAMPEFAQWAVAQQPKVRTSSSVSFAVPPHLFVEVPEALLIGALVDGHRYVSPDEDAQSGELESRDPRLLACGLCYEEDGEEVHPNPACPIGTDPALVEAAMTAALTAADLSALNAAQRPMREAVPEVPASTYGPDSVPLVPALVGDAVTEAVIPLAKDGSDEGDPTEADTAPHTCDVCLRHYPTVRGRDMHRRQKHPEA